VKAGKGRAAQRRAGQAREHIKEAVRRLQSTLFGPLLRKTTIDLGDDSSGGPEVGYVDLARRRVHLNLGTPLTLGQEEWAHAIAHLLLHLAFAHDAKPVGRDPNLWALACELVVERFLRSVKVGRAPAEWGDDERIVGKTEEQIYEELLYLPRESLRDLRTAAGIRRFDVVGVASTRDAPGESSAELLAQGIRHAVLVAVESSSELLSHGVSRAKLWGPGEEAKRWVMNNLPLLGALASHLRVVADEGICQRMDIAVAAVNPSLGEMYFNPKWNMAPSEVLFIYLHELLHVALMHGSRCAGRDPEVWNLACDFVINGWVLEMGVGTAPSIGLLFDPRLAGMSAEDVYDLLLADPRRRKGLRGFRGALGDVLFDRGGQVVRRADATTMDDVVRRSLAAGLLCPDRGTMPAGLLEEICSLFTAPVPWDVQLGRWMEEHVPFVREKRRSYARASRRQGATPDIPRPARYVPEEMREAATFGVVLDTSGSMDRQLLGRALGAIASFAEAREVRAVRLVSCDAQPYDHGFVAPEELRGVFPVRGRGGTVLQPGIHHLLSRPDLPATAPIMILTDGFCEAQLVVPREHCFVLPRAREDSDGKKPKVPLLTTAPVFTVLKE
jgi:predicted metal-dependent peptidase